MYRVNFLDLLAASISTDRFRTGLPLLGAIDGANVTFTVPLGDAYVHTPPFFSIQVYYNGPRLLLSDDYIVLESGGFGTGFDAIVMEVAPKVGDKMWADYIAVGAP